MSSPGSSVVVLRSASSGSRYRSASPSSRLVVRTRASSARSAAATSEGCAEAQKSFAKTACSRCSPSAAWHRSPPCRRHGYLSRQYQHRVAWRRLPPRELMFRSCGDAARRQASRSAPGTCRLASSSASVVPAPMRAPSIPCGTTRRTSTSVSACRIPSRTSGTTSVPPWTKRPPSSSERSDGRRSSTPLLLLLLVRLAQCAEQLLARHRHLVDVRARRVPDGVRDRGRNRHDGRLAEPLRPEIREMRVRLVDELAHDLRHVRDRGHTVRVERRRQHAPGLGVHQPPLRQRVADPLDDPTLHLALG